MRLELAGAPVTLADTAGLRDGRDEIEAEGVRRAQAWAASADLRLWVVESASPLPPPPPWLSEGDLIVRSKSDLGSVDDGERFTWNIVSTSTVAGGGTDALVSWLQAWAARVTEGAEASIVTRERHRLRLEAAVAHLDRAVYDAAPPIELIAEDVRLAARELERLTGRIEAEAVLGEIFSAFCIGK